MMTVNMFGENMYFLWDEASRDAVVVDPGMMREAEQKMVTDFIEGQKLNVKHVLLTHMHLDHVTGARWLADQTGADVCANDQDAQLGLELPRQVEEFHLKLQCEPLTIDRHLQEGDTLMLGEGPSRCCKFLATVRADWPSTCRRADSSSVVTPSSTAAWDAPTCGAETWPNSSTASARKS